MTPHDPKKAITSPHLIATFQIISSLQFLFRLDFRFIKCEFIFHTRHIKTWSSEMAKAQEERNLPGVSVNFWSVVELWPCLNLYQVVNQAKLIFDVIWGQFCAIKRRSVGEIYLRWHWQVVRPHLLAQRDWTRSSPSCEGGLRSGSTCTPHHTPHTTPPTPQSPRKWCSGTASPLTWRSFTQSGP